MKRKKRLTTTGENILILLCLLDLFIIVINKHITSINVLLYILYLTKIIVFIKYNKTFKK